MLSGQMIDHGIVVVSVGIVNLHPSLRMSVRTLQPVTFAYQSDVKAVGMVELLHGGVSSLGAQIRRRNEPKPLRLRDASGKNYVDKPTSYHLVAGTADYPAYAEGVPTKGGTQAYQYDRLSNIDTRSEHYGKAHSLLRTNVPGIPSYFKRRTSESVDEVVKRAACQRTIEDIKSVLDDNGLCYHDFIFDRRGGYKDAYALSSTKFRDYNWTRTGEHEFVISPNTNED